MLEQSVLRAPSKSVLGKLTIRINPVRSVVGNGVDFFYGLYKGKDIEGLLGHRDVGYINRYII